MLYNAQDMVRTRQPFHRSEETEMWMFLYRELRRANTAAYEPKGKKIWKDYVLRHGVDRTEDSLTTHFRRHMYNRLHDASLDLKSMMFLYGRLKLPITHDVRRILELKFGISIVLNGSGTLRRFQIIEGDNDSANEDYKIDDREDENGDPSTSQFSRSLSSCKDSSLGQGYRSKSVTSEESGRTSTNAVVSEDSFDFTRDIEETLAESRVRTRGLTNTKSNKCLQSNTPNISSRVTRSSTRRSLHGDSERNLVDNKKSDADRTSISSTSVQNENREEHPSFTFPEHTISDSQESNNPLALNVELADIESGPVRAEDITRNKGSVIEHQNRTNLGEQNSVGEVGGRSGNVCEYNPKNVSTSAAPCRTLGMVSAISTTNEECSSNAHNENANSTWRSAEMNSFRQLWRRKVLDRLSPYNISEKSALMSEIDKQEGIVFKESESKIAYKRSVRTITREVFEELEDLKLYYEVPPTVGEPFVRGDPNLVITLRPVRGIDGYTIPMNIRVSTIKGIICVLIETHPASVAKLCLTVMQLEALNANCAQSEEDYRNRMLEVKEVVEKLR